MKSVLGLLTLLVSTNLCLAAIKGGPRIIQEPAVIQDVSQPLVSFGKGGGGLGAVHHTVVNDPLSGQVVVSNVGGGIKGAGLGAGSAQLAIDGGLFGNRGLYRTGPASYPYGLTGLDYYSYPNSLLTSPRLFGRKSVLSNNLSGLRPVGYGGRKGGVIVDPSSSFGIGDAQVKTVLGGRRLYRTGLSPVPFGLLGSDYYSYPQNLLLQRPIDGGFGGFGQTRILGGGSAFTSGDSQISGLGGIGQEKVIVETDPFSGGQRVTTVQQAPAQVSVLDDGEAFGQRKVTTTTITESADPVSAAYGGRQITTVTKSAGSGLRGGNIILSGGPGIGLRRVKSRPIVAAAAPAAVVLQGTHGLAPAIGGFGQRQVVTKSAPIVQAPVVTRVAQAPVFARPAARIIQAAPVLAAAPIQRTVLARRPGDIFLSQVARPRIATYARPAPILSAPVYAAPAPVVQQRVVAPIAAAAPSIQFTLGGNQLIGGPVVSSAPVYAAAPRQVVVAAAPRPVVVAAAPRQVVVAAAPRPVVVAAAPRQVVVAAAPRPVVLASRPQVISQVKTSPGLIGGRRLLRRPQMVYVDGGRRFLGIDIIGGSRVGDPRFGYAQLPISTRRFASLGGLGQVGIDAGQTLLAPAPSPIFSAPVAKTVGGPLGVSGPLGIGAFGKTSPQVVTQEESIGPLGERQIVTTVTDSQPSKIGGPVIGGLGLAGVGQTGGTKTITQEEVVGPAGDPQIITTVTKSEPSLVGPSKIGGLAVGGLAGIGRAPSQVVTQEEVVGPAGDSQIITTVTETDSNRLVGGKIGGPVVSGPLGFAGIGQSPVSKTVTQEEVVGPLGDSQIVTTVTKSEPSLVGSKIGGFAGGPLGLTAVGRASPAILQQEEVINPITGFRTTSQLSQEIAQDPIEAALSSKLISSPLSQSFVDPISQVGVDDVGQVRETIVSDPFTGAVSKVTEVSQSGVGGGLVQQNIADAVVQQSISPGFGGRYGFNPRVSFLNQYPYDMPDGGLLRSVLTNPFAQQQQEVEQILVKK